MESELWRSLFLLTPNLDEKQARDPPQSPTMTFIAVCCGEDKNKNKIKIIVFISFKPIWSDAPGAEQCVTLKEHNVESEPQSELRYRSLRGEAAFLWLNHVYQQSSTPEAAGSRRTWLDGLGKKSASRSRPGQARDLRAVRVCQLLCGCFRPTVTLMDPAQPSCWGEEGDEGGAVIIHATPAEILKSIFFLPPSMLRSAPPAESHVTTEPGRVVWPSYSSWHHQPPLMPVSPHPPAHPTPDWMF